MPELAETLVTLESRLAQRLLDFERLDEAWPKGRTALERAWIGKERDETGRLWPDRAVPAVRRACPSGLRV